MSKAKEPEPDQVIIEWGRQFPNGHIDWQAAEGWEPPWSTPEGRRAERDAYLTSLNQMGIPGTDEFKIKFLRREKRVFYTKPEEVGESDSIDDQSSSASG